VERERNLIRNSSKEYASLEIHGDMILKWILENNVMKCRIGMNVIRTRFDDNLW